MHSCTCRDQALDLLGALEDDLVSSSLVICSPAQDRGCRNKRMVLAL